MTGQLNFLDLVGKVDQEEWAIAMVGFTIIVFIFTLLFYADTDQPSSSIFSTYDVVDLTLLHNAKDRGAFCLDGSLPGYHFQKGFGSGSNNWLLHLEGGGWCNSVASCLSRKTKPSGSSNFMEKQVQFFGILSSDTSQNPDFFNWNKVKIRYCDGASFAGHPDSELKASLICLGFESLFIVKFCNSVSFTMQVFLPMFIILCHRMEQSFSLEASSSGKHLWMNYYLWACLMPSRMKLLVCFVNIDHVELELAVYFINYCGLQALLSGCSAGGLATFIHCDEFRDRLPKHVTVKCLADAGFFLDEPDILGNRTIRSFYHDVVDLQGVAKSLNMDCLSRMESFKAEFVKNIRTPVFIVNPAYDFWQVRNILVPNASDPHGKWGPCKLNIHSCNPHQLEILQGYRSSMLKALSESQQIQGGGMFINSCFIHCQTSMAEKWHSPNSPRINSKTIAESVSDWYFDRRAVKQIDCPYPCNPTC
ncbi:hypothetical protein Pint_35427 [Pistacia integerrima]|uniref:Uncharacterized protein n=1 Tax=Pistacia integerrima TaxID=434235 RepID=A0ACC0Y0V5_9ROSI|nr:hypothetical protein Pint_35427 [Pistacia integerrima]